MENEVQTQTALARNEEEEEIPENHGEVDPIIAEEAEQFLREALEVSNRYGINLNLVPEPPQTEHPKKENNKEEAPKTQERDNTWETASVQKEAKMELQARLRKRIEEREAKQANTSVTGNIPLATPSNNLERVAGPSKASDNSTNEVKSSSEELSAVTKLTQRRDSEEGTKEMEVIDHHESKKEEEDNVEGFLIFCDETPSELKSIDYMEDSKTTPLSKRRKPILPQKIPKKTATNGVKPGNPIFGPQVVRSALVALGGRASAVAIAEWIAANRPQYLNYFGSQKKLRYSVSGILSARTYSGIFQKKLIIQKGIRKADWLLVDGAELPEEEPWDDSAYSLKAEEEEKISEESLSGLMSLSEAVGEVRQKDAQAAVVEQENPYEVKTCQVCNEGTNDDQLLLCDNCDLGYHMYCLDPPLDTVPQGAWFCEYCLAFLEHKVVKQQEDIESDIKEEDLDTPPIDGEDLAEGEIVSPRACEKHRRWKKRCPDNCPLRTKLKPGSKKLKGWGRQKDQKVWRAKRKSKVEDFKDIKPSVSKRLKLTREADNVPTYIEMIEEAIGALGGKGTTPDITNFMEEHHGELLATKTKTWRNSVSGCLSTHFVRAGKDKMGRTVWNAHKIEDITDRKLSPPPVTFMKPDTRPLKIDLPKEGPKEIREIKFKAPSRFSQKVYDPQHLDELRKNADNVEMRGISGIEYINRSNPLEVLTTKLSHPGAIMKMAWSNDGTLVATVSTLGTIRVWDTENWTQLQEIRDAQETNIEEFYCVLFSKDDSKLIAAGKIKDRNKWNEIEGDNELLPSAIKIFDVFSGKLVGRLEGHSQDVLYIKGVIFDGENYLLSTGADGSIIKWKMNRDFTSCLGQTKIADQRTHLAIHLDFVPNTGNKFFLACCDNDLKLFDFESEQLVQSFPGMFSYLCDCIEFVACKELRALPNEQYLLIKGVELMDEEDQLVQPNTCQLRKLILPEKGQGKFRLEEVNAYGHLDYRSNIWMLKLATNGRYVLSPTTEGKVFVWNIRSGELVAILNDHGNREVRDILFHPTRKVLLTCGDDSIVRIYEQTKTSEPPIQEVMSPIERDDKDIFEWTDEEDIDTEAEDEDEESKRHAKRKAFEEGEEYQEEEIVEDGPKKPRTERRKHSILGPKVKKPKKESHEAEDYELLYKRRGRGLPGACEKHKREHMKCSAECPNRKVKIPPVQEFE